MKRLWMPLYIGDYLADTAHLMATESGAYLHLLMHYWLTGPLPDDDARLCRIAKVHPPHWKRIRAALVPFFDLTKRPGLWSHHRADQELTKAAEISNKRKGAALQKHSNSSANAVQLHTQSQSQAQAEEKKDKIIPSDEGGTARYVFESGVIKINEKDMTRWRSSYSEIDVPAVLESLADWAATLPKGKWFHAVKAVLAKRNQEARERRRAAGGMVGEMRV